MSKQETTTEFSRRLNQAVEGHPLAPPTPFGRQSWLREKLEKEASVSVSPNTMSKWFNASARPRPDNVRHLARILGVDEVWLSMGRKREADARTGSLGTTQSASGAALLAAGLIELSGGKVIFAADDKAPIDLHVSIGGAQFDAILVSGTEQEGVLSLLVPEPVGAARVFAILARTAGPGQGTASVTCLDITNVERKRVGGLSVVELARSGKTGFVGIGPDGEDMLVPALESIGGMADA